MFYFLIMPNKYWRKSNLIRQIILFKLLCLVTYTRSTFILPSKAFYKLSSDQLLARELANLNSKITDFYEIKHTTETSQILETDENDFNSKYKLQTNENKDQKKNEDIKKQQYVYVQPLIEEAIKKTHKNPYLFHVFDGANSAISRYFPLGLQRRLIKTESTSDNYNVDKSLEPESSIKENFDNNILEKSQPLIEDDKGKSLAISLSDINEKKNNKSKNEGENLNFYSDENVIENIDSFDSFDDNTNTTKYSRETEPTNFKNNDIKFISLKSLRKCLFLRSGCIIGSKQMDRVQTSEYVDKMHALKQAFDTPFNIVKYF